MKVYFISGLAADRRVFKNILLPEGFEAVHLDWIPPLKNESLGEYALRLAAPIDRSEKFAIAGLSMGGMMASEISRHYAPSATIIISSVPSAQFLPFYFKIFSRLGLHKLVPVSMLKSSAMLKRLFTTETKEDKRVLNGVIKDSDPHFIRWAMHAVLNWNATELPISYVHIHGTRDEILPFKYTRPTHVLKGAGHMMVMNRAPEVNKIFKEVLEAIS